jgi:hypothetical protein
MSDTEAADLMSLLIFTSSNDEAVLRKALTNLRGKVGVGMTKKASYNTFSPSESESEGGGIQYQSMDRPLIDGEEAHCCGPCAIC